MILCSNCDDTGIQCHLYCVEDEEGRHDTRCKPCPDCDYGSEVAEVAHLIPRYEE